MKLELIKGTKEKQLNLNMSWLVLLFGSIIELNFYLNGLLPDRLLIIPVTFLLFIYRRDWVFMIGTVLITLVVANIAPYPEQIIYHNILVRIIFLIVALVCNHHYAKLLVKRGWEGKNSNDKFIIEEQFKAANDGDLVEKIVKIGLVVGLIAGGITLMKSFPIVGGIASYSIGVASLVVCLVGSIFLLQKKKTLVMGISLAVCGLLIFIIGWPAEGGTYLTLTDFSGNVALYSVSGTIGIYFLLVGLLQLVTEYRNRYVYKEKIVD